MPIETIESYQFKTLGDAERDEIQNCVDQANQSVWRSWPLRTFIYRNPLQGLEHLPFPEAVSEGKFLFNGRGYLSNESYRSLYHAGKITEASIFEAFRSSQWLHKENEALQIGGKRIETLTILKLHLIYGMDPIDESLLHWKVKNEKILSRYRPDVPAQVRKGPEKRTVPFLWETILKALDIPHGLDIKDQETTTDFSPSGSREGNNFNIFLIDLAKVGKRWTLGEWIQEITEVPLIRQIDEQMIKWCSAFLDEGMASWEMPSRDKGFYRAWLEMAALDRSGGFGNINNLSGKVQGLSLNPEDTIAGCLKQMGVKKTLWSDYLKRHLSQMPGWASFIKWRADEPENVWQKLHPVDPAQYLAVRLFYEAEGVASVCHKTWNISGALSEIQTYFRKFPEAYPLNNQRIDPALEQPEQQLLNKAWRFFNLAQFLGLDPDDLQRVSKEQIEKTLDMLDQFSPEQHGWTWLQALELSFRKSLFKKLSAPRPNGSPKEKATTQAQAVFCIDARSEYLRRNLEKIGTYETFGFAGFFGIPICYRPYGSEEEGLLCPALIKPKKKVFEIPRPGREMEIQKNEAGFKWHHSGHGIFHDLKANNFSAYFLIDFFGGLFGLTFIAKTFFPFAYQKFREKFRHRWVPEVSTQLLLDKPPRGRDSETDDIGFTVEEQVTLLENGLRLMGLTSQFSPIVLLCAHGSTSENNPYAAAYDCGACGGNHGGPNARALTGIANNPEVRQKLKDRGINIPASTIFIAGEHNTTTDQVIILDHDTIPQSHFGNLSQLQKDLYQAGMKAAFERVKKLPGAPNATSADKAFRHVQQRSGDWAQVRPEWGLSSNAAFIIARRKLTRGIDLEGRVFMHSYDPEQDTTGNALETIMTAPLLVVQWISMEYYFSSTDPFIYGSGNKVYHNVVSGIGVVMGRQSDLKPGLPMQSVMNGQTPFHEPMRPLAIMDAPAERVQQIIQKHEILKTLFDNGWIKLVVWNPDGNSFKEYLGKGRWERVT